MILNKKHNNPANTTPERAFPLFSLFPVFTSQAIFLLSLRCLSVHASPGDPGAARGAGTGSWGERRNDGGGEGRPWVSEESLASCGPPLFPGKTFTHLLSLALEFLKVHLGEKTFTSVKTSSVHYLVHTKSRAKFPTWSRLENVQQLAWRKVNTSLTEKRSQST